MAPKTPVETYLTDERKHELKDMLEQRGYDVTGIDVHSLEYCDRALQAGWKIPTTSTAESMRAAEPKSKQKKQLRTYCVHSAREHLGEPRQIKERLLDEHGFDTDRWSKTEAHWLDRALRSGWKLPTTHEAEAMKNADPIKLSKKNLRAYIVHSAREHLGEPVGQKHEA